MSPFILFVNAVIRLYVWKATKRTPADIQWAQADLERSLIKAAGTQKQIDYINVRCSIFYKTMLAEYPETFNAQALFSESREVLLQWTLHAFRGTFPFTHQIDDILELPYEDDLTLALEYADTFNISTKVYRESIKFWRCTVRNMQRNEIGSFI